jgi:phosphoserine phosphatase
MTEAEKKLIYFLTVYADGLCTRDELVTQLAMLPPGVVASMPEHSRSLPDDFPGVRPDAERLREQIKDATTTVMSSSGYFYTEKDLQEDEP